MQRHRKLRIFLFAALLGFYPVAAIAEDERIAGEVIEKAKRERTVFVLIGLDVPWQREETLGEEAIALQRRAIGAAQERLLTELGSASPRVILRYQEIPGIALEVDASAIAILDKSDTVTNVLPAPPALAKSGAERAEAQSTASTQTHKVPGNVSDELFESAQSGANILVLVGLKAPWRPEGALSVELITAQRNAIAASQDYLLAELTYTSYRITRRYRKIPGIALEVGLDALQILDHSAAVTNVLKDRPAKPKN